MISRSREKLQLVKDRLRDQPQKELVIYPCDVIDEQQMKAILLEIHQTYGPIDILFANAGVSFRQLSLTKTLEDAVRDTFTVNITGVINTIMPLIELKAVRQVAIVSSQAAYAPCVSPIYGASKQCVLLLGRDLRRMLAKDNIAVNIVSPGPVKTPMLSGSYPRSMEHGVSTAEAAEIVFHGLRRNQEEIVFPAVTGIFQHAISYLPLFVAETISAFVLKNQWRRRRKRQRLVHPNIYVICWFIVNYIQI